MSLGISDELLASMRADVLELLPDTCVIQSPGTVLDSGGDVILTYTPVSGGTVSCRVDPLRSGQSSMVGQEIGREVLEHARQLTCEYDAPLAKDRRVVFGGRNYDVVMLVDDHSWRVSRRAILRLVD